MRQPFNKEDFVALKDTELSVVAQDGMHGMPPPTS
jgi:hypothetical protein